MKAQNWIENYEQSQNKSPPLIRMDLVNRGAFFVGNSLQLRGKSKLEWKNMRSTTNS